MAEKIHCDLLALYGPNWAEIQPEKILCIAESVHTLPKLLGNENELYGFVGTRRISEDIVAGYFAIQYANEEFLYSRNKELNIEEREPFARLFFILFAKSGKVLLQNSKFAGIPLTMPGALNVFKKAIDHILITCGVSKTFNIDLAPENDTDADFVKEFERSTRVTKLEINYPNGEQIPDGFVYYNPQKERNSIIRDSHIHDYPNLKKVDLEATDDGDLRKTHLRDLVYVGSPILMKYSVDFEEFTLRKAGRRKFEITVDMDAVQVPEDHVVTAIALLRRERAVDIPTPLANPKTEPGQPDLFTLYDNDEDVNDEDESGD
jgi:hypothetical protein